MLVYGLNLDILLIHNSAYKVIVVWKIDSETITDHWESFLVDHNICSTNIFSHCVTIFDHCQLLELLDCSSSTILLSILNGVILLRHFKTKGWISDHDSKRYKGTTKHDNCGSLVLKVHSIIRIWHFPIQVLVLVTNTVMIVHMHIIKDW